MEKKGKGLIVTLIILIMVVLGLGGYIIYDKVLNNKPEPKNTKKIKTPKENLDKVAQILVKKLDKYYVDYYDKQEMVDFVNADDSDLILGAFVYGNNSNLTKAIVDDYYGNLFGKTITEYPDLYCWAKDGIYSKYNKAINEYEIQPVKTVTGEEIGHNHSGFFAAHSILIKANKIEKKENNYIITVTKIYAPVQGMDVESPENAFYADTNYTVKLKELDKFTKSGSNGIWEDPDKQGAIEYYEKHYNEFKNKTPQFKYTFKKDNENYYLQKYELKKG